MWKRRSAAAAKSVCYNVVVRKGKEKQQQQQQQQVVVWGLSRNYSKATPPIPIPLPIWLSTTPSSKLQSSFPSHRLSFSSTTAHPDPLHSSSSPFPDIDHFAHDAPVQPGHGHFDPPGDRGPQQHQHQHEEEEETDYGIEAEKVEALLSLLKTPTTTTTPRDASFHSTLDTIFPGGLPNLGEGMFLQLIHTPSVLPDCLISFFQWAIIHKNKPPHNSYLAITPTVVDALVRAAATKHTVFALWDLLKEIALTCDVVPNDIHSLHSFIALFSELCRGDQVFEVFSKIADFGSLPNSESYYLTIAGLCRGASSSLDDRACKVVCQRMLEFGALPDDAAKVGDIIRWFCKGGRVKEAHAVYATAKEKANCPPYSDLHKLIGLLSRQDETVGLAAEMLDDLKGDTRKKAINLFSSVILGFCRMKDVRGARLLLSKMISRGPPPGNDVFNQIVTAYSKNGDMEETIETMKLMESRGLKPDVYTYTVIMSGYARVGLMEEACKVLSKAKDKHSKLAPVTYHTLIRGYCNLDQFDKALELLAEMKQFGVQPNVDEYAKLVQSLCLRALDWEAAEKLLTEMEENGLHRNGITKGLVRAVRELDEEGLDQVASMEA